MKLFRNLICLAVALTAASVNLLAQKITASIVDENTGEAISFATVSITRSGADKPTAYTLSDSEGKVLIEKVRKASYVFKAEIMGYVTYTKEIALKGDVDLGVIKMKVDSQVLDAASVSASGNAMMVKKDTIEFNANSFRTTENDALEELLRKIPGMEISEDGTIKHNGEVINKITINGKTFFLDDPQLASKNIPARLVEKVKVFEKKSEQAEFTGIDDGESQTVIDLSVRPGMMNGLFGSVMAGGGHDLPSPGSDMNDWRWQGAGFAGRFSDKSQITVLLNGNNTNNRGFNDLAGSMMQGMMGGRGRMGRGQGGWGGSNGITTSYMGGANAVFDLLDDRMELGGNYLFNGSNNSVSEISDRTTYLDGRNIIYDSDGKSLSNSWGHRFGIRLDHKFSDNTSILFEPRIDFGGGDYSQTSRDTTYNEQDGLRDPLSNSYVDNTGSNRNVNASGFLLFRQRLGIPGRTLTAMARVGFSNNDLDGANNNGTHDESTGLDSLVNQTFTSNNRSWSMSGRLTYTEPLGGHFYLEANYSYNWNRSSSEKETFDQRRSGVQDYTFSNNIINESNRQEIGVNALFQDEALRAQLGFSAMPTSTYNQTTKWNVSTSEYSPMTYDDFRWNFSPRAMLWWDISEGSNMRLFYRGSSSQPSTSQLMPVPDITDPMNVGFGNPTLTPYFSHNMNGRISYNNRKSFTSFSISINGGYVQNPIVNMLWYGGSGAQYSMPFNGPDSGNASISASVNSPIAKSDFSITNNLYANWSTGSSYVGSNIDMSGFPDPAREYYAFMEQFINRLKDRSYFDSHVAVNTTDVLGLTEYLKFTYRTDALEVSVNGRSRINKSWYTISQNAANTLTFNNRVGGSAIWNWELAGLCVKADFNYNWYRGYSTAQPAEYLLDAEIQKFIFNKKFTLSLKGYDLLGQSKNLTVSDSSNYHSETRNNTLGRYVILSLTYRFGTFDRNAMPGGPHGGRPPMMR